MNKRIQLLMGLLLVVLGGKAQSPLFNSSTDIYQQLKKLNVLGSVLYIAAHPDDENNTLLPYLAKEKLYRTAYLSLTRGDGGQNLIGSEQGIDLGLIRTEELLAARRQDGAEQYFTRAYEFGFSKSSEEALRIWDEEKILSDVVYIIRKYQPDVIIKRFPPDARAGHGHHAASAIIADKAFIAAADPNRFPEQLKYGVKPWQAKRIVWNTFNFGGNNTTSDDQLKIDVGGYNALLGKSYGEIGGEARSMHKSQGEGRPRRRGPIYEFFTSTGGDAAKSSLLDGVAADWTRLEGGIKIQSMIQNVISHFNFDKPSESTKALIDVYNAIKALPESAWRNKKLQEAQELLEACAGLFTEAVTGQEYAVQGDTLRLSLNYINRTNVPVSVSKIALLTPYKNNGEVSETLVHVTADSSINTILENNKPFVTNYAIRLADDAPVSQPYWLSKPLHGGAFEVTDQRLIGDAESRPNYVARFVVQINGEEFTIDKPVLYKVVDPVKGEIYEPLTIQPKAMVSVTPNIVLSNVSPAFTPSLSAKITSNIDALQVPVSLSLKNGGNVPVVKDYVIDLKKGNVVNIPLKLKDIHNGKQSNVQPVLTLQQNGKIEVYDKNMMSIKYDHIPYINYLYNDNLRVIDTEVKTVGKKIGYIVGAGDKVPEALLAMGYSVSYINEADITEANLQQFDAIVIGIRAHNIYEYLSARNDVFNNYIYNGGNLIVQYIKSNMVGSKRVKIGPYPFTINAGMRVTEEDAAVRLLLPNHPAFNYPNKITNADFENWVQERSTYQVEQSDEHFDKLVSMNDKNDKPSDGSLAIAKYGKGNIAYVSLVLFRQLPAAVPGSYRLLANLIALPKNKITAAASGGSTTKTPAK